MITRDSLLTILPQDGAETELLKLACEFGGGHAEVGILRASSSGSDDGNDKEPRVQVNDCDSD